MRRVAIVIGSNGPADSNPLQYAEFDAARIARVLGGPRCYFEVFNLSGDADPSSLHRRLTEIATGITADDFVIIYFSGHGFLHQGSLFLMLDKTDMENPLSTALISDYIMLPLQFCRAKNKLLILDCCHAGNVYAQAGLKAARASIQTAALLTKPTGLRNESANSGFLMLLASDRFEKTRELDLYRGSFLGHFFARAFEEDVEMADADGDGLISVDDMNAWLEKCAEDHNTTYPKTPVPTPIVYGRTKGKFHISAPKKPFQPRRYAITPEVSSVVLPIRYDEKHAWCVGDFLVTNSQYEDFCSTTRRPPPSGRRRQEGSWDEVFSPWENTEFNAPDQPVVCVSFDDAAAYVEWLKRHSGRNVGLMPSKLWHFAAYPFSNGHAFPGLNNKSYKEIVARSHSQRRSPGGFSVRQKFHDEFGVIDLIGNAWEWVSGGAEWYQVEPVDLSENIFVPISVRSAMKFMNPWVKLFEPIIMGKLEPDDNLYGGSYLTDLLKVAPAISLYRLSKGEGTKHSDLGFRIAATVRLSELPQDLADFLQTCPILDAREPRVSYSSL